MRTTLGRLRRIIESEFEEPGEEAGEEPECQSVEDRCNAVCRGRPPFRLRDFPFEVEERFEEWQENTPYAYDRDERLFYVDDATGLIIGFDMVDNNFFATYWPDEDVWKDFRFRAYVDMPRQ